MIDTATSGTMMPMMTALRKKMLGNARHFVSLVTKSPARRQ